MSFFRAFSICFLIMCLFGFSTCKDENGNDDDKIVNVSAGVKGKLLILQAFGTGDDGGRAVDRSFVELYNSGNNAINLKGAFLWYADGVFSSIFPSWKMIELDGIIPAKGSYLITGEVKVADGETAAYKIPDGYGDIESSEFILSNRAFRVVLLHGLTTLTDAIQNPFNVNGKPVDGYLDMVGARNSAGDQVLGYETAPARNSRSATVRRKNLTDTDNNQGFNANMAPNGTGDFISLTYADLSPGEREAVRPRNSDAGSWNPFQALTGVTINSASLNLSLGSSLTLSAQLSPFNANSTGITYTWTVLNQSPAGVLTFDAANKEIFTVTAATAGTATVTLTLSGGVIKSPLTNSVSINVSQGTSMLMILQANGHGNNNNTSTGSGFHKSAVELYNNTNSDINLSMGNFYLHIGTGGAWTNVFKLEGTVPARCSFLIVSNGSGVNTTPRAVLPTANQQADFDISNNAFKIAIMRNRSTLMTVNNPFTDPGLNADVIDLLGAINGSSNSVNASKGSPFTNMSRPRIPRRASLIDTNNNSVDYIDVDTRESGNPVSNNDLYKVWPRNSGMGPWNPITGQPPVHPVPSPHL